MGLPILGAVGFAAATVYYAGDNSKIDKESGQATWDVPWDTHDFRFEINSTGLQRTTAYMEDGSSRTLYVAKRGKIDIFINQNTGEIYLLPTGEKWKSLSPSQLADLTAFNNKVIEGYKTQKPTAEAATIGDQANQGLKAINNDSQGTTIRRLTGR